MGTAIRMASEDLSTDVVTWLHFKLAPTNGHNKFDTWTHTPQEAIGIRKSKRGCSPPVARPPWQLPGEHPDANMFEMHWGAADRPDVACHLCGLSQYRNIKGFRRVFGFILAQVLDFVWFSFLVPFAL